MPWHHRQALEAQLRRTWLFQARDVHQVSHLHTCRRVRKHQAHFHRRVLSRQPCAAGRGTAHARPRSQLELEGSRRRHDKDGRPRSHLRQCRTDRRRHQTGFCRHRFHGRRQFRDVAMGRMALQGPYRTATRFQDTRLHRRGEAARMGSGGVQFHVRHAGHRTVLQGILQGCRSVQQPGGAYCSKPPRRGRY